MALCSPGCYLSHSTILDHGVRAAFRPCIARCTHSASKFPVPPSCTFPGRRTFGGNNLVHFLDHKFYSTAFKLCFSDTAVRGLALDKRARRFLDFGCTVLSFGPGVGFVSVPFSIAELRFDVGSCLAGRSHTTLPEIQRTASL